MLKRAHCLGMWIALPFCRTKTTILIFLDIFSAYNEYASIIRKIIREILPMAMTGYAIFLA